MRLFAYLIDTLKAEFDKLIKKEQWKQRLINADADENARPQLILSFLVHFRMIAHPIQSTTIGT